MRIVKYVGPVDNTIDEYEDELFLIESVGDDDIDDDDDGVFVGDEDDEASAIA
jgi:hypothetical protein